MKNVTGIKKNIYNSEVKNKKKKEKEKCNQKKK